MAKLRPYQVNITAEFHSRRAAGARSILLVAPNESGKRIIAASIVKSAVAAGQRVMVVARRREIIEQTARKLRDNDIDPGIIQAGFGDDPLAVVQVASVQTLHRSAIRGTQLALPAADSLILDECHHATARTELPNDAPRDVSCPPPDILTNPACALATNTSAELIPEVDAYVRNTVRQRLLPVLPIIRGSP